MDDGANSYRRFLDGEEDGIIEIVRMYKDGLILFLNRYVDNLQIAEELSEDTFFRLVTRKPPFVRKSSFKTWLYTIGRNLALTYLKRAKRAPCAPAAMLDALAAEEATLEQAYLREERKILVHRALSKIKLEYATVLYLKFFEELTSEQIAHVLKKNKRQVENLAYQAKRALRANLEKEGLSCENL